MAKYLLLKHYRGSPAPTNDVAMNRWTPEEVAAHVRFMDDFAETKDLMAGWMAIDVDSRERAIDLAGQLSAAPAAGGRPLGEWLEVRSFLDDRPNATG
ncbi:MAG: hypothetical protein ABIU87_13460 [Ornithinibacter sp.]